MKKTTKKKINLFKIQKSLIKIVERKKKIKASNMKDKLNYHFIGSELLDSIELINFIIEVEENFKIKFSSKDTESKDFRKLSGVAKLVFKKLKK